MSVELLIGDIEVILDEAKPVPFSDKLKVDAEEIKGILDKIRSEMPEEVNQARRIANERRTILDDAQLNADDIIAQAKKEASEMIEAHNITKEAQAHANDIIKQARVEASELLESTRHQANDIMEQAHKWATDIRTGASEFVEDIIKKSDDVLTESVNEIRRTRQQLRIAAAKKVEQKPDLG